MTAALGPTHIVVPIATSLHACSAAAIGDDGDGSGLVSKFYKDSVVFITGGTGFLGKVLVEKLLRVFLIKRIYLLVRAKNNLTVNERLEQYFRESVSNDCACIYRYNKLKVKYMRPPSFT